MSSIILATLNAKYPHCAFGLRYLLANMGELRDETALLEFTINQPTLEILDAILMQRPRVVGLGVYIWNVTETTRLVADLKRVAPNVIVVLGGPEVSYETDQQEIVLLADHVITGEADLTFAVLCRELLSEDTLAVRGSPDPAQVSTAGLLFPIPTIATEKAPLTLTLSPQGRGEGTRRSRHSAANARSASPVMTKSASRAISC